MAYKMLAKLLREDLFASLSGGLYFDCSQPHVINLVHLYTWIILFVAPLFCYLFAPNSIACGIAYCLSTSFITAFIKMGIWNLYKVLDKTVPQSTEDNNPVINAQTRSVDTSAHLIKLLQSPSNAEESDLANVPHGSLSFIDCAMEERCKYLGRFGLDIADYTDLRSTHRRLLFSRLDFPSRTPWILPSVSQHDEADSCVDETVNVQSNPPPRTRLPWHQFGSFRRTTHRPLRLRQQPFHLQQPTRRSLGHSRNFLRFTLAEAIQYWRQNFVNPVPSERSLIRHRSVNLANTSPFLSMWADLPPRSDSLGRINWNHHNAPSSSKSRRKVMRRSTRIQHDADLLAASRLDHRLIRRRTVNTPSLRTRPVHDVGHLRRGHSLSDLLGNGHFVPYFPMPRSQFRRSNAFRRTRGANQSSLSGTEPTDPLNMPITPRTPPIPNKMFMVVPDSDYPEVDSDRSQAVDPTNLQQSGEHKVNSSVRVDTINNSSHAELLHADDANQQSLTIPTVRSSPPCDLSSTHSQQPRENGSNSHILVDTSNVSSQPGATARTDVAHGKLPTISTADNDPMVTAGPSTQPVSSITRHTEPSQPTFDALLAELMGVPNLTDAGLTREHCLALLDAPDAENLELEIASAFIGSTVSEDKQPNVRIPSEDSSGSSAHVSSINNQTNLEVFAPDSPLSTTLRFCTRRFRRSPTNPPNTRLYPIKPIPCLPWTVEVRLGRLHVENLFDKSTVMATCLAVILSCLVSAAGYMLLRTGAFQHGKMIVCCFVIAGCHYSLLKSVQPDPASPQHGFNRIIIYSRAIFFCLFSSAFVLMSFFKSDDSATHKINTLRPIVPIHGQLSLLNRAALFSYSSPLLNFWDQFPLTLTPKRVWYAIPENFEHMHSAQSDLITSSFSFPWFSVLSEFVHYILLVYPILILFGFIPQSNTALIYVFEQVDIHVFGGSGSTGVLSSVFSIIRNIIAASIGYVLCSIAIEATTFGSYGFCVFWALFIPICYLLSRLPSNVQLYALLLPTKQQCSINPRKVCTLISQLLQPSCLPCSKSLQPKHTSIESSLSSRTRRPRLAVCSLDWWRNCLSFSAKQKTLERHNGRDDIAMTERLLDGSSVKLARITSVVHPAGEELGDGRTVRVATSDSALCRKFHSLPSLISPIEKKTAGLLGVPESAADTVSYLRPRSPSTTFNRLAFDLQQSSKHAIPSTYDDSDTHSSHDKVSPTTTVNDPTNTLNSTAPTAVEQKCGTLTGSECFSINSLTAKPYNTQQVDPLPSKLRTALLARLWNDSICYSLWAVIVFGLCATPAFHYVLEAPFIGLILTWTTVLCGALLHTLWPELRKAYPWSCFAHSLISPSTHSWVVKLEIGYYWFCWVERNILIPCVCVIRFTADAPVLLVKFGPFWASLIIALASMKLLRNGFTAAAGRVYMILLLSELLFTFDFSQWSVALPVGYMIISVLLDKLFELSRKLKFIFIYTAPCRITWGSLAHAIIQIAAVPHGLFILGNCFFSTLLSAPLEPFMASALFISSYARPIKFWEVSHKTERMETTNTALSYELRGVPRNQVSMNLNAIFYEHLARTLQTVLAGEIQLGRLGGLSINHGDVLVLNSDEFNLLLHIIEIGNGLVSFQLRGLEFVGTYCHNREIEALHTSHSSDDGCFCFHPGHVRGFLSGNAVLRLRCMSWQFVCKLFTVDGYRIINNGADTVVRMYDYRKVFINNLLQCIIFYLIQFPDLPTRLETLLPHLESNKFTSQRHYDLDPVFLKDIDADFDEQLCGVTRRRFVNVYGDWIRYCVGRSENLKNTVPSHNDSPLVSLCYAMSLLGRRCMGGTQAIKYDVNQVLRGMHDIFKGDIRIMNKDEWILADLDLLQSILTQSMRITLKLNQDYFLWQSELNNAAAYRKIVYIQNNFVIYPETDPRWRFAILNNAQSLFSIRWVGSESDDAYRFVQLNNTALEFNVVKINSECVRGLWAAQQREQIFIRNTNTERASIQGAQHVLRNLINSSCDPPIGYPIYVSPILTSFVGTHPQLKRFVGSELSFSCIYRTLLKVCCWVFGFCRRHVPVEKTDTKPGETKPSIIRSTELRKSTSTIESPPRRRMPTAITRRRSVGQSGSICPSDESDRHTWQLDGSMELYINRLKLKRRASANFTSAALVHFGDESDAVAAAHRLNEPRSLPTGEQMTNPFRIIDTNQILLTNLDKLIWPSSEWKARCIRDTPFPSSLDGQEVYCIHRWTPMNSDPTARSFCLRTIALVSHPLTADYYIAIWEDKGLALASGACSI